MIDNNDPLKDLKLELLSLSEDIEYYSQFTGGGQPPKG